MLLHGDEMGHSKKGNNNTYCQDNELSWLNWKNADKGLIEFTCRLIHLRKRHPVFSRKNWFQGKPVRGKGLTDIGWSRPDGSEMEDEDWQTGFAKSLAIFLFGGGLNTVDQMNKPLSDDSFYIIFNADANAIDYKLPAEKFGKQWRKIWDTAHVESCTGDEGEAYSAGGTVKAEGRSVLILVSSRS
jgi:glycogen operon protein